MLCRKIHVNGAFKCKSYIQEMFSGRTIVGPSNQLSLFNHVLQWQLGQMYEEVLFIIPDEGPQKQTEI